MIPFTVKSLAKRWACSEAHVRNLINRKELRAFRLGGKLMRISGEEVEAWEKRNSGSDGTGESSVPCGTTDKAESAIRSARLIEPSRMQGSPNSPASNVFNMKAGPQR